LVAIDQVSDDVFSSKIMGDGFAIQPTENTVYTPIAGEFQVFSQRNMLWES
jgi:phosphotransferase system IIA component